MEGGARFREVGSDLLVVVSAFLLFTGSYKVNEYFDSFMLFAAGVSLIYIPAGVKLLCLLVGGVPAILGLFVSSLYLNVLLWSTLTLTSALYFATIGVGSYAMAVYLTKHYLSIKSDLSNLNYWHIVVLSVAASFFNGFGQNFVYLTQGVTGSEEFLSKSTAMAFGDFLGCFLIVMLFNSAIQAAKRLRSR
jgi:hypothetical protein